MVAPAALFLLALSGQADGAPLARGAAFESSPWVLDVRLESALLDVGPRRLSAQSATRGTDATPSPPEAPPTPPTAAPAAATEAGAEGQCAQCDVDCDTCHEAERQARYLLRRRERNLRVHRGFALAAWGGLAVTEVLGTILAINKATWAGNGNCASPEGGIGGAFGCGTGLVALHETFAFITTGLYTTAGVIAATAPDPDNAASGDDPASRRLALHKTLAWVHGAGMVLLPILGILAASPQIVGLDPATDPSGVRNFQTALRSVHAIVGYTTFATFSVSAALELF